MSEEPKKTRARHNIKSLRLDVETARQGKTWLLLPEGFRDREAGKTYPLPSVILDLQILSTISLPPNKNDSGCTYIKRAMVKWKRRLQNRDNPTLGTMRKEDKLDHAIWKAKTKTNALVQEVRNAVDAVKEEAEKAGASLRDLFALGRSGLKGQMEAHLAGEAWQGEQISAQAFRQCFGMVTTAVKGLGLPSDQKKDATEAIREQYIESLKDTQDAIELAPTPEDEGTEH